VVKPDGVTDDADWKAMTVGFTVGHEGSLPNLN
jgi:hypothetical protein